MGINDNSMSSNGVSRGSQDEFSVSFQLTIYCKIEYSRVVSSSLAWRSNFRFIVYREFSKDEKYRQPTLFINIYTGEIKLLKVNINTAYTRVVPLLKRLFHLRAIWNSQFFYSNLFFYI